jgi:tRNA (guanine-N7-)-methyltransferase
VRRGPRLPLEELAPHLLEVPPEPAPLDWSAVYGNANPVAIEVGFGKGLFLVSAGQANPEMNFLGIEILRKYQLFTATRLAQRGLGNVRLVKADARQLLRDYVAAASVQAMYVYFPDPWWKKRHLKRRVFTAEFVASCARILRPGGRLHVVTDVAEYFEVIGQLLEAQPKMLAVPTVDTHEPAHDLDYLTHFERKFRKEGRTIYGAAWERSDDVP